MIRSNATSRQLGTRWQSFGRVLCDQLEILKWKSAREKSYPFLEELTPEVFLKSNAKAFQCLMHFLLNKLDPVATSEIFFGIWPILPGNKKAEAQFRSAVFKSLKNLQKGQGISSGVNRLGKEANEEARRLGPVLLSLDLNPSTYSSAWGEECTVLLARFAALVASVDAVRLHGSGKVNFAPVVARPSKRLSTKRTRRARLRSAGVESSVDRQQIEYAEAQVRLHREGEELLTQCDEIFECLEEALARGQKYAVGDADDFDESDIDSKEELLDHLKRIEGLSLEISRVGVKEAPKLSPAVGALTLENLGDVAAYRNPALHNRLQSLWLKARAGAAISVEEYMKLCLEGYQLFNVHCKKQCIDEERLHEVTLQIQSLCKSMSMDQESLQQLHVDLKLDYRCASELLREDAQRSKDLPIPVSVRHQFDPPDNAHLRSRGDEEIVEEMKANFAVVSDDELVKRFSRLDVNSNVDGAVEAPASRVFEKSSASVIKPSFSLQLDDSRDLPNEAASFPEARSMGVSCAADVIAASSASYSLPIPLVRDDQFEDLDRSSRVSIFSPAVKESGGSGLSNSLFNLPHLNSSGLENVSMALISDESFFST